MLRQAALIALLAAGASASAAVGAAQPPAPAAQPAADAAPPKPNDYSDPKTWLCRPGGKDACAVDEAATVVAADGTLTRETWSADPRAPIDCFYVYPTVSNQPTPNATRTPDPEVRSITLYQALVRESRVRDGQPDWSDQVVKAPPLASVVESRS